MDIKPLRIRLDLTKINVPPYRRFVWYPVSPCALSTITDLKTSIRRKFNLSKEVLLFVDGGLMQDEDTVLLLRENDVVQVVYSCEYASNTEPSHEDLTELTFVKNASQNCSVECPDITKKHKKKKKKVSEFNGSETDVHNEESTPKPKKSKKEMNYMVLSHNLDELSRLHEKLALPSRVGCDNAEKEILLEVSEPAGLAGKFNAKSSLQSASLNNSIPSCVIENSIQSDHNVDICSDKTLSLQIEGAEDLEPSSSAKNTDAEKSPSKARSSNCKKRKRKRKRRRAKEEVSEVPLPFVPSTINQNVSVPGKSKHIKFVNGDIVQEPADDTHTEANSLDASVAVNYCSEKSEESSCSEADVSGPPKTSIASPFQEKLVVTEKNLDYMKLPSLTMPPKVGTCLAFKMLELSESYCPEVSKFKEGVITGFDSNSGKVTIQLAQQEMKLPHSGKFENVYEDETPEAELVQKVAIQWSSLIDPKLLPKDRFVT